ncbi:hypothetical protein [Nocardioides pyridinolyticus]
MSFWKKSSSPEVAAKGTQPVVVVPPSQFDRLMGPDRPSEVPSALRDLVLKQRAAS